MAPFVDAHVYGGFTYDFYFKRFGRRGLDNANLAIRSVVHPVDPADSGLFFLDDLALLLERALLGSGVMVYGEGLPPNFIAVPDAACRTTCRCASTSSATS